MSAFRKNIWHGISSVMSIWPSDSVYTTFVINYKSDEELLLNDWVMVGNDIRHSMEILLEEKMVSDSNNDSWNKLIHEQEEASKHTESSCQ